MSSPDVLEAVEIGDLVGSVAQDIARAQLSMDMTSIKVAALMAEKNVTFGGEQVSVLELGLTPVFYQFVDTVIEVKITITTMSESSSERSTSESKSTTKEELDVSVGWFSASASLTTTTMTSTVDTRSATRFQHSSELTSSLRTRIVPVPPPTQLMERLRLIGQG